jgi:hypothetical protein
VPSSATNIIAIAAGGYLSLALKADGSVICWGYNTYGQTNVPSSATNIIAIAAGGYHSIALKANGSVIGWGLNTDGQTNVPSSATNIIAVAAGGGGGHNLALKADGSVISWGLYSYGQTNVPSSATNVIAIAAGLDHSLALKADGSVIGWGYNFYGQSTVPKTVNYYIGYKPTVSGVVNTNTPGIYQLAYSATNSFWSTTINRTVVIVDAPYLSDVAAWIVATNSSNGARTATFNGTVSPNGLNTTAFMQFGASANYLHGSPVATLPASFTGSNLVVSLDGLAPGFTEHWRVVASNSLGQTVSGDQTLTLPASMTGDANNDGVVSADEAAAVMRNYWTATPAAISTPVSLGQGQFAFGLANAPGLNFTVLTSTNLTDWEVLTNASAKFLFSDPATNSPQRYYRLRWP